MRTVVGAATTTLLVLAALLLAQPCAGQIPQKMNYQVMLTDDSDQPLADQSVQLVFRIYDQETAGAQLWTETHNTTTNSVGVVSVILGETTPLAISFAGPLWLQVEVDGEVLSPRRELVSAAYSLHDETGGAGDGHSLDADDGDPVDALYVDSEGQVGIGVTSPEAELHVRNELQVGAGWTPGTLHVKSGYATSGAIRLEGEGAYGGSAYFDDGMGETYGILGASTSANGGGRLWLSRNSSGSTGFWLDANHQSSQDPRFEMLGDSRGVVMDMGQSGDLSVVLPTSSISKDEMLDEVRVASALDNAGSTLSGSVQQVDIRSLTAPTGHNGYILAMGTVWVTIDHYGYPTTATSVRVGLTDSYPSYPATQDGYVMIPGAAPNGQYHQCVTVHGLFNATAGLTKTVSLYAQRTSGSSGYYDNAHLTLVYIPESGGTIETIGSEPALGGLPLDAPASDRESESTLGDAAFEASWSGLPSDLTGAEPADQTVTVPKDVWNEILTRLRQVESVLESSGAQTR